METNKTKDPNQGIKDALTKEIAFLEGQLNAGLYQEGKLSQQTNKIERLKSQLEKYKGKA